MKVFVVLLFSLVIGACQTTPKCGLEKRAAFDIGSGSTKMKVVEVNTCVNEVTQVLLEEQKKIDYRDALEKNPQGEFPQKVQEEGMIALAEMKGHAQGVGAQHFAGIATAAFREAKNAETFVKEVRTKLRIPIRVISQNEEAMLGFNAVVAKEKIPAAQVIVWDIGGGSQQMTAVDGNSQPVIYYGQLASVSFKNHVIAKIQKKDIQKVTSPNPLKKEHVHQAVAYAEQEAKSTVPEALSAKVKKGVRVIGMGGVLGKSIPRQLGESTEFSQKNIQNALERRASMKDSQIQDPFAATEVTNLALVVGYMRGLGIDHYTKANVSLIDGLWWDKELWK